MSPFAPLWKGSIFLAVFALWAFAVGQDAGPILDIKDPSVKPPTLIKKMEPSYTEQARSKNISGNVLLSIVVDKDGLPRNIIVVSPLGFGLDEKAIESVSQWRFKPGTKDGVPVAVVAQVEVSFRLCGAV